MCTWYHQLHFAPTNLHVANTQLFQAHPPTPSENRIQLCIAKYTHTHILNQHVYNIWPKINALVVRRTRYVQTGACVQSTTNLLLIERDRVNPHLIKLHRTCERQKGRNFISGCGHNPITLYDGINARQHTHTLLFVHKCTLYTDHCPCQRQSTAK